MTVTVEATVTGSGDIVIPAEKIAEMDLKPGRHVNVSIFEVRPRKKTRSILADKIGHVPEEVFDDASDLLLEDLAGGDPLG